MAVEIERKFLVLGDGWRAGVERSVWMEQGYLGGDRASVRIRIADAQAFLNIKSRQAGTTRLEFEYPLPLEDARVMLAELCRPGRICKRRHYLHHGGLLWEVDEFGGENLGLVVAEVELPEAEHPLVRPDWLGREVTGDIRYYNDALARHPFRDWAAEEKEGG
ncbi:MAG: CYTH domain-containing protein [Lysobacteraceae bacterium]|nr:MAG: CYTH domain-containing protein [Xanthomonadaceae bacterium]